VCNAAEYVEYPVEMSLKILKLINVGLILLHQNETNLNVASKRLFLRVEVELAEYPTGRVSL
jgi:hypothetical protein